MPGDIFPTQVDTVIQGNEVALQDIAVVGFVVDHGENFAHMEQTDSLNLVPDTNKESCLLPTADDGVMEAHAIAEQNSKSLSKLTAVIESTTTLSNTRIDQEDRILPLRSSNPLSSSIRLEDTVLPGDIHVCAPFPANESSFEVEVTLNVGKDHTITQTSLVGVTHAQAPLVGDEEAYLSTVEHTGLNHVNEDVNEVTRLECEDGVKGAGHLEDFPPSSSPPSSSPPQLFSSSPYASSQSSRGDSGNADVADVEGKKTPQRGDAKMEALDERGLESKDSICYNVPDCATPEKTAKTEETGSKKQLVASESDSERYPSQLPSPSKRVKLNPKVDQPPVPKRVTLSSQHRQFKKLAAPFRPPIKINSADAYKYTLNRNDQMPLVTQSPASQRKIPAKKISKSNIQFKSPLIGPSAASADSPTIRLTPAVQTLERKLQQLKRAVKVKDEKEEHVLFSLTNKWLEAGREVAYEVWEIVRNSGDAVGTTPFHRSRDWAEDRETKLEDTDSEFREISLAQGSRATGSLTIEENVDDPRNTMGIMLRQLGIAPETLGWDEDKEVFVD